MVDFIMQLGSNIFEDMKLRIEQMHALELSPTQIMSQHEQNVKELARCNERLIMDIFCFFPIYVIFARKELKNCGKNILRI